mmetsp:Transcript_32165/g.76471  ORF Transcript_32165/g.76471 Transcript_32165/m.76471 type:complete len:90 (+) Transcript_32165:891-1160(+)
MISTEEEKVFRVFDLIGQKQRYGFKTLFATVNIVSKEKIVCFRRKTSIFKQTKQITILAMDVSYHKIRPSKGQKQSQFYFSFPDKTECC